MLPFDLGASHDSGTTTWAKVLPLHTHGCAVPQCQSNMPSSQRARSCGGAGIASRRAAHQAALRMLSRMPFVFFIDLMSYYILKTWISRENEAT
jgi:hypothetical protein